MLKQRVVTASLLALLAIFLLFKTSEEAWQWVALTVGFIAAWEWAGFARFNQAWQKAGFALLTAVLTLLALNTFSLQGLMVLTAAEALLLVLVVTGYQRSQGKPSEAALVNSRVFISLAGFLSVILFTVVLIRFRADFSADILLMSLFVVWAVDTGAYFSGKRFGKTKLAIHVSPGKTWEGVWGGSLLAFLIALLGLWLVTESKSFSLIAFAMLLALIALFSVFGDLFESVLKRQVGLKDSGQILPGHGGILDRIDSLLIAVPMLYLASHLTRHFGGVL